MNKNITLVNNIIKMKMFNHNFKGIQDKCYKEFYANEFEYVDQIIC